MPPALGDGSVVANGVFNITLADGWVPIASAWLAVGSRQYAAATGGSASDAAPATPEPAGGGIGATTSFGLNTAPKPPKRGESFEKGADFDTTTATPRGCARRSRTRCERSARAACG